MINDRIKTKQEQFGLSRYGRKLFDSNIKGGISLEIIPLRSYTRVGSEIPHPMNNEEHDIRTVITTVQVFSHSTVTEI